MKRNIIIFVLPLLAAISVHSQEVFPLKDAEWIDVLVKRNIRIANYFVIVFITTVILLLMVFQGANYIAKPIHIYFLLSPVTIKY